MPQSLSAAFLPLQVSDACSVLHLFSWGVPGLLLGNLTSDWLDCHCKKVENVSLSCLYTSYYGHQWLGSRVLAISPCQEDATLKRERQ